jgi:hypothetical protein
MGVLDQNFEDLEAVMAAHHTHTKLRNSSPMKARKQNRSYHGKGLRRGIRTSVEACPAMCSPLYRVQGTDAFGLELSRSHGKSHRDFRIYTRRRISTDIT